MKIIDLTQTIYSGMPVYEGDPEVEIEQIHSIEKQGWNLSLLEFGSHTGTHVDAPVHMNPSGDSLDDLALGRFISKAQVVEMGDESFPIGVGLVFREGELDSSVLGRIILSKPTMVITGNVAHLPIDTEKALLLANVLTFTDLINLDQLPKGSEFTFYGIPLKWKNADGSPIRAFAIID